MGDLFYPILNTFEEILAWEEEKKPSKGSQKEQEPWIDATYAIPWPGRRRISIDL